MAVSVAVCEIFSVKKWHDLKTRLRVVQGHCEIFNVKEWRDRVTLKTRLGVVQSH